MFLTVHHFFYVLVLQFWHNAYWIQLFDCVNGASSSLEFWPCMPWSSCFEIKEKPAKSCLSQPICCWWLGYIYSITCRCMCISWSYSFVHERLALLQRTTIFPMRQVPNLYCFGIYLMVPPCHFFSCHVLAFGQCMNHSTSITVQYSSFYLVNIVVSGTHLFFLEMPEFSLFNSELLRLTHKIVAILCCNHLFCRTEDWEKLREEILFCRSICYFCIDDWKQILFLMKTPL